jgi:hypothetical protein
MEIAYKFVNYGEDLSPEKGTLVLDVGLKTVPGVIDHHHPDAEPECTASLITKYPHLVLDHIKGQDRLEKLQFITHRLPDFDALASIFLSLKLIERGAVDSSMEKIARYTKMVDSASLPKEIEIAATPYSILRALFSGAKKDEKEVNAERAREGLKFMKFLYSKSEEGYEIVENRLLFKGIERYERAMRKVENDYFHYLEDLAKGQRISLFLPLVSGSRKKKLDGLIVKNPKSFLLKEWARRDKEHPSLGEGFTFLLTNFGNKRYILGVDPEKGVNLKGLGEKLNQRENEKRVVSQKYLIRQWYIGNCSFFNYRIIDSPQDETLLSHEEVVESVLAFGQA